MKNFLITPFLFENKYKKIVFGLNYEWYEFAGKNKINLIIVNNKNELDNIFKIKIHGLILSGGNDLFNIKINKINLLREKNEIEIVKYFIKKKLPIIGICKGFQLFAKMFGSNVTKIKNHQNKIHDVIIRNRALLNKRNINTNSFHKYGIKNLPKGFEIIGATKDNNIEIALNKKKNFLGLMFHPERKNKDQLLINTLINKFIK